MSDVALQLIEEAREKKLLKLDLGRCDLKEIPEQIFELSWLKQLNLGAQYWNPVSNQFQKTDNGGLENSISILPKGLKRLKSLKALTISNNSFRYDPIIDIQIIRSLPKLTLLELCFGKIENIDPLASLSNLQVLNLTANSVQDLTPLQNLTKLTYLFLGANEIRELEPLSKLRNLRHLALSQNRISNILAISELVNLTGLHINLNDIRHIHALRPLKKLKLLNVHSNKISDITALSEVPSLTDLNLDLNFISNLEPLRPLTRLKKLSIGTNNIQDISPLYNLDQINKLYLNENKIKEIGPLKGLKNLTDLYLDRNEISDITPIQSLRNLVELSLAHNKISDITALADLVKLKFLYLNSNRISEAEALQRHVQLSEVNLAHNVITSLQSLVPLIDAQLPIKWKDDLQGGMILEGNPISSPPIEIVLQGETAILNYFKELEQQGTDEVFEAKLLIIGEGGAGKTTLARKLQNEIARMPDETESTHGIEIHHLSFKTEFGKDLNVNIWDFGGQEIYHATHQFFLTKRSLYILVDDTRKDDRTINDTSFNYWLQVANLFGGGSPLLIVQNEKSDRKKDLDMKGMIGRFDFIKDRLSANFLSGRGLENVRAAIQYHLKNLPHVGTPIPKQWVAIRTHLEELSTYHDYISITDFFNICQSFNLETEEKALLLSSYLHDIGVILHYQDDSVLENIFILDNQWVTDAVYSLLDNQKIRSNNGKFTRSDLLEIWSDIRYKRKINELIALMLKFELCYEIEEQQQTWLAPQLFPAESPENLWEGENDLTVRLTYDFMPKGILSRFIVRMHRYIKHNSLAWRSGVVLERANSESLVSETYAGREIVIRSKGPFRKELMTLILEEFERIHERYENLTVKKLIPCNCVNCSGGNNTHYYLLENLLKRKENRIQTVQCENSYLDIDVQSLLEGVFSEATNLTTQGPVKVFISYSHADEGLKNQLCKHLSPLVTSNKISLWSDREIKGGQEWNHKIIQALNEANIVLFMVSADFISSDYVLKNEINLAMERHRQNKTIVVPVWTRSCDFTNLPFSALQGLPSNGKAVDTYSNKDEAFTEIAVKLKNIVSNLKNPREILT